jgi:prevent-host-death family protein
MPRIGIRDLKNQAPEILRHVREEQTEYVVTYRGEPIAVLLPIDEAWRQNETRPAEMATPSPDLLTELELLRQEIEESWQSDKSAVELIAEQRR